MFHRLIETFPTHKNRSLALPALILPFVSVFGGQPARTHKVHQTPLPIPHPFCEAAY